MHILITGGTGFIGRGLVPALQREQHTITILTRQSLIGEQGLSYVRALEEIPADTAVDAVINLAGASLADKRWTGRYKREIVNSRLQTTQALISWLTAREQRPAVLLSGSAIGYYGHHQDEMLDEDAVCNPGFAQGLCREWEAEALKAAALGIRVCTLRLGVVLDSGGGCRHQA